VSFELKFDFKKSGFIYPYICGVEHHVIPQIQPNGRKNLETVSVYQGSFLLIR